MGSADVVHSGLYAAFPGAVGTTKEGALRLDPVPDNLAPAMFTHRSESVDGAFEAVKSMSLPGSDYLE
jgi:hypothetical protein